jgi:hypothetical protein
LVFQYEYFMSKCKYVNFNYKRRGMTITAFYRFPPWIRVLLVKNEIEMLLHDLPESNTFELFVPYWEDLPIYQAAAAEASLEKGRQIIVIFPSQITISDKREEKKARRVIINRENSQKVGR